MTRLHVGLAALSLVLTCCSEPVHGDGSYYIIVEPSIQAVPANRPALFAAMLVRNDLSAEDVTEEARWISSDTSVATIEAGLATPVRAGDIMVTAEYWDLGNHAIASFEPLTMTSCRVAPDDMSAVCGQSERLTVMAEYEEGGSADVLESATWETTDSSIATVDDGYVTALHGGSVEISATIDGIECTPANLNIVCNECTSINISAPHDNQELAPGSTLQLVAFCDISGSDIEVTGHVHWYSSDPGVVTVSNSEGSIGEAIGIEQGTAQVWVEHTFVVGNVLRSPELELTVVQPELVNISITPSSPVALAVGGSSQQYTATCIYEGGTDIDCTTDVTWVSSDELVATISNDVGSEGLATPVQNGTSSITAEIDEIISNVAILEVHGFFGCESIEITTTTPTIPSGGDAQFTATCTMSDGSTMDVTPIATWASDDINVATIGPDGVAQGVVEGVTNITATVDIYGVPLSSDPFLLTVTGHPLVSISVEPDPLDIVVGATGHFVAVATFVSGATLDVTALALWHSDDILIATVSNDDGSEGTVTGVNPGSSHINAIYEGVLGTAVVNVGDP